MGGGPFGHPDGAWFNEIAAWLKKTYWAPHTGRVMAFTKGTVLSAARAAAPHRSPRSLHLQIVRSVPLGAAVATTRVRHAGCAVGTVGVVGPNTDLTLRFTTAPATREILAAATLLSIQHGTTTVAIDVRAGDHQLAHGLATSLLLKRL